MCEHYIIGVSAHTVAQARRAEKAGADYLGVGALFPTNTKEDAQVRGLSVLKSLCTASSLPVIGIGGITNKNCRAVFKAGASGIAVSSFVFEGSVKVNMRSLTQKG